MKKLFAKKALRDLAEESNHHHFKRVLGPFSLTALGIGAVIGAGIFVLTGLAAKEFAGPGLILSFVLSGLACIFVALCYAEFASMIPLAGSAYTYSYAALGEVFAWIIGWDLILEYSLASSLVAVGWSHYFVKLLGLFGLHIPHWLTNDYWTLSHQAQGLFTQSVPFIHGIPIVFNLPAALIIIAITTLLVIGIKESARFNSIIVGVKLAVILLVIFVGWFYVKGDNWGNSFDTFAPYGIGGIGTGAAYVFFAYIGFDAVSTTAQEARNPKRDVPIGIIASLILCTILYIAVTAVLTGMVYYKDINIDAPLADAFTRYGLTKVSFFISVGAIAGLTSVLLVLLLSQSRIFWAIARDGLLPERIFATIHPRFGTPYISTIIVGACVALTASCFPIEEIAKLVNIGTLLAFCLVSAAVIILRVKDPNHSRAFKCPFVPVIPILGILSCGYMMIRLEFSTWLRLLVWLAIGAIIYAAYGRHHSKLAKKHALMEKQNESLEELDRSYL
ncbi:MAG: amino acid permease [Candidatus Brocadia sp.]|jgi:APA family basic amino acid/polyamine antiporter